MILWKPHVAEDFPNGKKIIVGIGGHMHENLETLIQILITDNAEREWGIAMVKCNPTSVVKAKGLSDGWYEAIAKLESTIEGFRPLKEVEEQYLHTY